MRSPAAWSPGPGTRRAALLVAIVVMTAVAAVVGAADVTFRAEVDARKVGVEDRFQLVVSLQGSSLNLVGDITQPALSNLRLVAGPSVSTQISFINGAVSQSRSYVFVLQPIAPGRATIGPARAAFPDGERSSEPITIEVVPGSVLPQRQPAPDPFADAWGQDPFGGMFGRRATQPAPKLFVEAVASRTRLYVGEPLLLTYYLYTQTSIAGLDFEGAPQYPGFWVEDLGRGEDTIKGDLASHGGESYRRFVVFRRLLFPTRSGALEVPSISLRIAVPRRVGVFMDPSGGAASMVSRSTEPIQITVDAVPEEADFSGAVGKFSVGVSVDRSTLAAGEAATVRFRVEGSGNLKWVERGPRLEVRGAKVYPPQVANDLAVSPAGIRGSKSWDFVVVPATTGSLPIQPLSFVYFDPSERRIVRARTAPLELQVRRPAEPATPESASGPAAAAPASAGLRLRGELELRRSRVLSSGSVGVAFLLVAFGHGALWLATRVGGRRSLVRSRDLPRVSARGALALLRRATGGGMAKEAAAALIERALVDVFGEPSERPTPDQGEPERSVSELLQEVRFVRYAPQLGDYSEKIAEVARRAAELVRRYS